MEQQSPGPSVAFGGIMLGCKLRKSKNAKAELQTPDKGE